MKLTTAWMNANYMPARAGIDTLAQKKSNELVTEFISQNAHLWPGFSSHSVHGLGDTLRNKETGLILSLRDNGTKQLVVIASVGCGKYHDMWDSSNWFSLDTTPEQQAAWAEANIREKVKQYKQELAASNLVMQLVSKEQPRLTAKYEKAHEKVRKAEARFGQDAGEWFDGYFDNEETDTGTLAFELVTLRGYEVLWDDLVDCYKLVADHTCESLAYC